MPLLDVLFPPRCGICSCMIEEKGRLICTSCEARIERINESFCPYCGREDEFCSCQKREQPFDGICAVAYYSGAVKHGIWRFKFHKHQAAFRAFGGLMAGRVQSVWEGLAFDGATFVPMMRRSEKKRGYNQAELLAIKVAKELKIPLIKTMKKTKETSEQHRLGRNERQKNLEGAFSPINTNIKGMRILLVDDVITTGATFSMCAGLLKAMGADSVYCVAFGATRKKVN